ncbi:PD-(D/E)XK nuclease family protein [Streptomyces sp. NPDC051776]|uniref:RecB family exonuclease n=1 Tax=Streptomyces sp. NPDC051776 TaxID=3155414 RepID=UPI0034456B99
MTCPLLYRFRVIDRIPEKPSEAATRGTLVHAVLERLFDDPAVERTAQRARSMVAGEWERLLEARPELADLFSDADPADGEREREGDGEGRRRGGRAGAGDMGASTAAGAGGSQEAGSGGSQEAGTEEAGETDGAGGTAAVAGGTAPSPADRLAQWLREAERLVERWFALEDPTRLEPAERELYVETELESGLTLRGIIDRVDVAPTGDIRIVDYKTGKAPRPEYASGPLFQMKFYALVLWRLRGTLPRRLQLVYLGSGDVLTYDPVEDDLRAVERKLHALWEAIKRATETGDWRPRPSRLCDWCDHQALCPEFGGTPPPYPLPVIPVQGRMGQA